MKRQKGVKLTIKEKKFAAAKAAGKTNREAYKDAGYSMGMKKETIDVAASNINRRPTIQKAIDEALAKHNLTPDYAVQQLAKIVEQDEEMGAKRLAIKDSLELMGYTKNERPQVHVSFEGSFFERSRSMNNTIEGEVVDGNSNEA